MFRFCQRAGALLPRGSPRLRSDSTEFVFHSLVFEAPHFTYLEAQEFFVTSDAACEQPLQVQRRKVPRSVAPPLEFYVLPAVELYMFPGDVQNVSSTWKVLILPRSREVFGQTVYLCRKPQGLLNPCIAKLPFPGLPLRLINFLIGWDPALDSSRSTPHRLLLLLEVLVLSLALCAACLVLVSVRMMMKAAWKQHTPPPDGLRKETLLGDRLPKVYILIQHGFVYKEAGKGEPHADEPLDACREVTVLEMVQADRERRGLVEQLQHILLHRGEFALRGRLADPPGWIVLANAAEDVRVIAKGATPSSLFCANVALLEPFPSLLRRQWVLTASHLSVQFYLLESLSKMFEMSIISVISASLLAIHLLVLWQMEMTHSAALLHEQVMESQGKLLSLTINKTVLALLVPAVVVLLVAVALGILRNESMVSATIPCTSLATTVAWHLMDFRLSLAGLGMWRSPQLRASEFIGTAAKGFETISTSDLQALSRGRELQKQMIRFLVGLLGVFAFAILVLLQIDGMNMRGELIDYSFSRGHLSIPPTGLAIQNTLLLHTSVDSFVFRFEAGKYTSKVQLHVEHAYSDTVPSEPETIFDENVDTEAGAGKRFGETWVSLPSGPLYSRLIVAASSHLQRAPTRYTVHLLRVGEATNLSLEAPINPAHFAENDSASSGLVDFHERRRWLYQQNNPVWYVPDVDARSNSSLRVEQLPVVFAPVWKHEDWEAAVGTSRDMVTTASTCLCGTEEAGFGTSCVVEEPVTLPSGTSTCLFQYGLQRELHVDDGPGSVAVPGSNLPKWLSGIMFRPAVLELLAPTTGQVSQWQFSAVQLQQQQAGTHHGRLTSVLETSLPTEMLLTQVALLATEDMTYAEGSAVPLKIVTGTTFDSRFVVKAPAFCSPRASHWPVRPSLATSGRLRGGGIASQKLSFLLGALPMLSTLPPIAHASHGARCTASAACADGGATTNADDLQKAKELREQAGLGDISASAQSLEQLPDVIIDEGTFKYVLLRVTAASGERKYLVRGTLGAEFHKDVALPYVRAYLKDGFGVEILGGGRILHDVPRGFLKIYGFSYGFPWADGAGHEISAEVCREFFSGYEVDWTNDGY
ncbi:PHPT1 [Symbiodinium microadriaticum]|nr:PHPT1 [Symbiodinium microadriaticum]